MEFVEEVRGVEEAVTPVEAKPAHVLLDGTDVVFILLGGVGVVHAEVALAAEFCGHSEVDADCLRVADVEVAIRFRREARYYGAAVEAATYVALDELPNEVPARFRSFRARRVSGAFCDVFHFSPFRK